MKRLLELLVRWHLISWINPNHEIHKNECPTNINETTVAEAELEATFIEQLNQFGSQCCLIK